MSRLFRAFAAAAALSLIPAAALADEFKPGPVEEKHVIAGKAKLDPAAGYIFVQATGRTFGTFLRVPDEQTRAEYEADWQEAFAKAQKKYVSAFKNWETALKARQTNSGVQVPPKPVEPSRETVQIGAIELRDMVSFGPMFIYNKGEDRFAYLHKVKPGTYVYYGPVSALPNMPAYGSCNCMGSVRFEVKPGTITDLGNSLAAAPVAEPPYDVQTADMLRRAQEKAAKDGESAGFAPMTVAYGLPDTLKAWPSIRGELSASGKMNNYFGLTITRMPPIPGVLGYRRDAVLDLRTGAEVASPTIYTQVRIKK